MTDVATLTIAQVAPLVQRREVSPVEVTAAVLHRIDLLDGTLRAYLSVFADEALAAARAAEREIAAGSYRGPLHGLPLSVKDCLAVRGWPTTNGSRLMADNVTTYDATAVRRLREAGAIVVGKNTMHEWAMGGTCSNMSFGTVRNPWNQDYIPGGSSGGSAVAVSASMAFGAIGTDAMGSIRTPAAYCGVVGVKATYGLVSRFGELPPTSSWMDHVGPIAKDVRDAAILLQALAGFDPRDPTSIAGPPVDYGREIDRGVAGLRVGVPHTFFYDETVPPVAEGVGAAVRLLEGLGAEVRDVEIPSLEHVHLLAAATQTETQAFLLPFALEQGEGFASQDIRYRVLAAEFVRAADRLKALRLRNRIRREFQEAMQEVDLLVTPTNSSAAYPIDAPRVVLGRGDRVVDLQSPGGQNRVTTRLTFPLNAVGLPAITVPCGFVAEGLPYGVQLIARRWREDQLFRAAHAYESASGNGYRLPPTAKEVAAAER